MRRRDTYINKGAAIVDYRARLTFQDFIKETKEIIAAQSAHISCDDLKELTSRIESAEQFLSENIMASKAEIETM